MERFHKQNPDPENSDFSKVLDQMIGRDFTPTHEPRTPEEIQKNWDEQKARQSKKFDPENLEQKELF